MSYDLTLSTQVYLAAGIEAVGEPIGRVLAQHLAATREGQDLARNLAGTREGEALVQHLADSPEGRTLAPRLAATREGQDLARNLAGTREGQDLARNLAGTLEGRRLARDLADSPEGEALVQHLAGTPEGQALVRYLARTPEGQALAQHLAHTPEGEALVQHLADSSNGQYLARNLATSNRGRALARELADSTIGHALALTVAGLPVGHVLARELANSPEGVALVRYLARTSEGRRLASYLKGPDQDHRALAATAVWCLTVLPLVIIGVAATTVFAIASTGPTDENPVRNEPPTTKPAASVTEAVGDLDFVDRLEHEAAGALKGSLEPLIGYIDTLIQDKALADNPMVEDRVRHGCSYLHSLLYGDPDGTINAATVVPVAQHLMATIKPFIPNDAPGADVGSALAHQPDETPNQQTAKDDADTIGGALDPALIDDLPEEFSVYDWLADQLNWTTVRRTATGAAIGSVAGTTDTISGILQALNVTGPWSVIIAASIGILTTTFRPRDILTRN